jgi:hypothetical protein
MARAGNLFVLDYRGEYRHDQHIHSLAIPILQSFLVPWMNGDRGAPVVAPDIESPVIEGDSEKTSSSKIVIGLTATALLGAIGYLTYQTRQTKS